MSRLPRICSLGIAQHVIQRGNNRQICFGNEQDFFAYIDWLKEFSVKFEVNIHAWVLMTNHVHLLCTPCKENGVSQMMQALGKAKADTHSKKIKKHINFEEITMGVLLVLKWVSY